MRVLVLSGPNLNLLGTREPETYGTTTLAQLSERLDLVAAEMGVELEHFQSNHEGGLVDRLHSAAEHGLAGVVFNPAAYTHTSIALRDAVLGTGLAVVEVHMSNVHKREPFRHRSLLADVVVGQVVGFGAASYELGLRGLVTHLRG